MLSVTDLIERETLPLRLAAELLRRVRAGSGFLVGASPGGAGKTAVMGALLTMLPSDSTVHLTSGSAWRRAQPGEYVVAYEISPAFYEAYIWDRDLRDMCALAGRGCRLVSNLHADTLDEARDQVVGQNGASPEQFQGFDIFIPIQTGGGFASALRGGMMRRIDHCYVAEEGSWSMIDGHGDPPPQDIADFLERCLADGTRRIEDVRARWMAVNGA
jgi:hypothetical protein